MEINEVKIEEIKAYKNNAKKHDAEQIKLIANSIKQFGFRQPVVLDKNMEIIIGHGRLEAAKTLGMKTVPCVMADDLSDEQIKALRIADNKLSEKGSWDNDVLAEELKEISESINMLDLGFGEFELEILTGDFEPTPYNDEEELKEYAEREKDFLAKERVIITFDREQKDRMAKILGIPELTKVAYDIKDILALRGE